MSRRRGKSGRGTFRGRLPALAATLAAPLVIYLILRVAFAALPGGPGASLPPADHSALMRRLARLSLHPQFTVTEGMQAFGREYAVAAPLAYEPFFLAARAAEAAGRSRAATTLLEETRRRRPTYLPARLQLILHYARIGRYPESLAEMDTALNLSGEVQQALLPGMTKLLPSREGRQALAKVLAEDPPWRKDFLEVASGQPVAPADAESLLRLVAAEGKIRDLTPERGLLLASLMNAGDFRRARSAWLGSLPAAERARHAFVFDGAFRETARPGPFSWTLHDLDVGRAEKAAADDEHYLDVAYFGGRNVALADQVLALAPGNYTLRLLARAPEPIRSGNLYWQLYCLPGERLLIRIDLDGLQQRFQPRGGRFAVPGEGCAGQRLRLSAEAGDVASVANVQVAKLEISR